MGTRVVIGVIAVLAALAGCGGGEPTSQGGATKSPAPPTSEAPPAGEPGGDLPSSLMFAGTTVDGGEFKASTLAGKPVVLWFWAPWCPKCKAAAPDVARLAGEYDGKVAIVGVGGLGKPGDMRGFVKENKTGRFVNLADEAGDVWRKFGVKQQHTYVLITADGTIAHTGGLTGDQLEARVGKLAA